MSSGDVSGLAAAVVAALVQQAARAAGEELTALGPLLEGVREGIGRLPRWARALERLEGAPGDEAVRGEALETVGELLAVDGPLREALAARWPGAPAQPPVSGVTVGASPVSHTSGQVAIGSGNIAAGGNVDNSSKTFNRRGSGILAAVLAAAAALAGLGLYLGRSPGPQPADVLPGAGHTASVLAEGQVRQVLPDLHAVPAGWALDTAPDITASPANCAQHAAANPLCGHIRSAGSVTFSTNGNTLKFAVWALDSTDAAAGLYREFDGYTLEPGAQHAAIPALGEASTAVAGNKGIYGTVRAGTTVLIVTYLTKDAGVPWDRGVLAPFARMLTTRSRQAQDGQPPSAVVP
ncbi:hypothetical protein ACFVXG_36300 [Kitasatospora sp. NPDC058162]|uniref:hypothetical protein n=1 Tax=Kitasatospora sp. NPDC058162 TaxID=3346362 RepID=UPI0036DE6410